MEDKMKAKIVRLSKNDGHYHDRKELIGLTGEVEILVQRERRWLGVQFVPDNNPWPFLPVIHFAYVKIEEIKE